MEIDTTALVKNITREVKNALTARGVKNSFDWYKLPKGYKIKDKDTVFGSWEEFEKATGKTKEQYMREHAKEIEDLAEKEVRSSIYKR